MLTAEVEGFRSDVFIKDGKEYPVDRVVSLLERIHRFPKMGIIKEIDYRSQTVAYRMPGSGAVDTATFAIADGFLNYRGQQERL